MEAYVVVRLSDGLVINKIVANANDEAPIGCILMPLESAGCDIGWIWNGLSFLRPEEVDTGETFDV